MHKHARPHRPQGHGRPLTPWPGERPCAVSRALVANEEGIAGERRTVRRGWHTGAATLSRTGRRRVEVGETSKNGNYRCHSACRTKNGRMARAFFALSLGSLGSSTSALWRAGRLGYSVIGFAIQHWTHPPAWRPCSARMHGLIEGAPVNVGVFRLGHAGLTALNWRQIKHLHTRGGNGSL